MGYQKGQKQLTSLNKDNILSSIAYQKDTDGLHYKDVCSFILAKMGLEFDREYTIKEMVDKIIETGNTICTIKGKKFDSDFYTGIKESFGTNFQKKIISKIILDKPDEFEDALKEFNKIETIDSVDIIHEMKDELIKINGIGGIQILVVKLPY